MIEEDDRKSIVVEDLEQTVNLVEIINTYRIFYLATKNTHYFQINTEYFSKR